MSFQILDLRGTQYDQRKRIPDYLMKEIKRLRKVENAHTVIKAIQVYIFLYIVE